jgi:hypothetical protein
MLRGKKTLVKNASFVPYLGPHMRNYIRTYWATVSYSQINPNPPPPTLNPQVQYFITGDAEATASQTQDFIGFLDPAFFQVDGTEQRGALYWLLDKDIQVELITAIPNWQSFVGTSITSIESPKKSWSNGK